MSVYQASYVAAVSTAAATVLLFCDKNCWRGRRIEKEEDEEEEQK